MMEEPQNNPEPQPAPGHEAPAKGPAKVIRAGGDAKAAAASAAVPILRAGRHAVEGAEAAGRTALEGADAAGQKVVDGVEAAVCAAEKADDGAGGQVLREWVHCAQRAYVRNIRALGELLYCRTPYGLMLWQSNLLSETAADLSATNLRIARLASQKA